MLFLYKEAKLIKNGFIRMAYKEAICTMSMGLESVLQSEVNQKEKNKYYILMHICGIQKNDTDEPIYRIGIERQTQRTNIWIPRGKGGERNWEIGTDRHTLLILRIKWITNENLLCSTGNSP